jgi:putative acetyltransferase
MSAFEMVIRPEKPGDERAIDEVVRDAFAGAAHSSGTESLIVKALRDSRAITISLVAAEGANIVGHVAVSPVRVRGAAGEWFGIGPLSVRPQWQRRGIGRALTREALEQLRRSGAAGCVVLGDPNYYGQFGFEHDPSLCYRDVPPPYFQFIAFAGEQPTGSVDYHPAFELTA